MSNLWRVSKIDTVLSVDVQPVWTASQIDEVIYMYIYIYICRFRPVDSKSDP